MKSRPSFNVEIKRHGKMLSFECEYMEGAGKDEPGKKKK
jgi:hypothetical protein